MFRLNFLICVHYLIYCWNIFGWTYFKINYKLIFKFDHHFSDLDQILARFSFLYLNFIICLLWFVNYDIDFPKITAKIDFIPIEFIPLVSVCISLMYFLLPYKNYFNWEGRQYIYKSFLKILKEPFS